MPPVGALSDSQTLVCIFAMLLIPLAGAGLALINTGLGRSRSAAHSMLASLCITAVAALVYCLCGFAWQGFAGRPAHVLVLAGKQWNWLGADSFLMGGLPMGGSVISLVAALQLFSVGLAAVIPTGSGADRWRLGASCASTALLAGWIYPLFAHWSWGGGWLAQLGTNCGLGRGFVDVGGAASIQALGGIAALAIACILGPRHGKHESGGLLAAVPGHNLVLALSGCMLALVGWSALDLASAILFFQAEPKQLVLIVVNNLLAAGAALLAVAASTRVRFGKPDASLATNGWVAGLVAISACGLFVSPMVAAIIGAVAGLIVPYAVEWLDHLAVDDPGGAVTVHAVGGIWGVLAVGIVASGSKFPNAGPGQWLAQLVGVATLLGTILPMTYFLNWLLNRVLPQRAPDDGARQGMDLYELGAGAYPEQTSLGSDFL